MEEKKTYLQDVMDAKLNGVLSLFVAEIQDALDTDKLSKAEKIIMVRRIMQGWIDGCKLSPEKVKKIPRALTDEFAFGKLGFDAILEFMEGKGPYADKGRP